jgi:ring-1,2-phenylacetyl-CoA epoxidase subunit PaaC
MNQSIEVKADPAVRYLLRLGDTCLIHAQRLSEWCGHASILEEDIALTNMALDLIGQARAVLTLAGATEGSGHTEDQLVFLRNERDYLNPTIVELPRGDFALTTLRNLAVSTLLVLLWDALRASRNAELSAIAGKALKEALYHQRHAAEWCVRLGDGTEESRRRMNDALTALWPYVPELFDSDPEDGQASAAGLGPTWASLQGAWREAMGELLAEARLAPPKETAFRSTGRVGRHSEHMGYILAEMQQLQRAYPGGSW